MPVDLLVNNAGSGIYEDFLSSDLEAQLGTVRTNVDAVIELTFKIAAEMRDRGRGEIIQVSSLGAYFPLPKYAIYSATKAFVLSFSSALRFEMRKSGVQVTTLLPGTTRSEFFNGSGQRESLYQKLSMMTAESVVRAGLRGLEKRQATVIPGVLNKASKALLALLPSSIQITIGDIFMKVGTGTN